MNVNPNAFYVESHSDRWFSSKMGFELILLNPIAIGTVQAPIFQADCAIAIGPTAGLYYQGECAIAIGSGSGSDGQSSRAIAIGLASGQNSQSSEALALGSGAGAHAQSTYTIALGSGSGATSQSQNAVALGSGSGAWEQSQGAVAIGSGAGQTLQSWGAIAFGQSSGQNSQSTGAVAVGSGAGASGQSQGAIALGSGSGASGQSTGTVAIGSVAGASGQSQGAVAIGALAGENSQHPGTIVINATSAPLNTLGTDRTYIAPLRNTPADVLVQYTTSSKELVSSNQLDFPTVTVNGYVRSLKKRGNVAVPTNTANFTKITNLQTINKWFGGVLAPNGKIYSIPVLATTVMIIDPTTDTFDTTSIQNLTENVALKWNTGVLAPNGKIYATPYDSSSVLIIDPVTNTANTTTIQVSSAANKWWGAALATNGKIYNVPRGSGAGNVLIVDPVTNTVDTTSIVGLDTANTDKYIDAVATTDGKVYGIPIGSTNVLIVDPSSPVSALTFTSATYTNSSRTLTGVGTLFNTQLTVGDNVLITASGGNFTGYVQYITSNTSLVFLYALGTTVGTISGLQKTRRADVTTIQGLSGTSKWFGGTLAPDGKIYGIPRTSTSVLIIDPNSPVSALTFTSATYTDGTRTLTGVGTLFTSQLTIGDNVLLTTNTGNFTGYVQSITNNTTLVFLYALGTIGTISGLQKTRRADVTTISGLSTATGKWAGGVLAPNGQIYGVPYLADNIFKVDPVLNTINSSFLIPIGTYKYAGGVLGADGKIYAVPHNSSSVMIIDPNTDTIDLTTITGLARDFFKWCGGVLWSDRKMYFIPYRATSVLIVDPSSPITILSGTSASATYTNSSRTLVCPSGLFTNELVIGDNVLLTTTSATYTGYVQYIVNNTTVVFLYALGLDLTAGTITHLRKTRKADVTTITGLPSISDGAYYGANIGVDGKIYCTPYSASNLLIIDPSSPITPLSGTFASATYTNSSRTLVCPGAVFTIELSIGDNVLITTPTGAYTGYVQYVSNITTVVLVFALGLDLTTGTITNLQKTRKADVTTIPMWSQIRKYGAGTLAPNGKIYMVPSDFIPGMILDPSSPITALSGTFSLASYTDTSPARTLVCPNALFLTELSVGDNILFSTTTGDYMGYVVTAPSSNTTIVLGYALGVNLATGSILNLRKTRKADAATLTGFGTTLNFQFAGMVTAANGLLYGIPSARFSMSVTNPTTNTTTLVAVPSPAIGMMRSGILAQNGLIYGIPNRSIANVPIITPSTNSINQTTITGLPTVGDRWWGGVLAPNGKIYGMPSDSSSVLIINPGLPSIPLPWMRNASFNKL